MKAFTKQKNGRASTNLCFFSAVKVLSLKKGVKDNFEIGVGTLSDLRYYKHPEYVQSEPGSLPILKQVI
jgi:hypothetical protein